MKQPREGVQTALTVWQFVKVAPSRARRSICGVATAVPPWAPTVQTAC